MKNSLLLSCILCLLIHNLTAQNLYWAKQISSNGYNAGNCITTDNSGNHIVTGFFSATADFDPGAGSYNLSAVSKDIFILKLDFTGNFIWAKSIGGTSEEAGNSVVTDASGNIYVTGYFKDAIDFDPGSGFFGLIANGTSRDAFLVKLNSSGVFQWALSWGSTGDDEGTSVSVDNLGNVLVTGNFFGTVDFDPGSGSNLITSEGNADVFVCKVSPTGSLIWAGSFGSNYVDLGKSVKSDASNNVIVAGTFTGTADFDPGVGVTNLVSGGLDDSFVCKLDANGNLLWAKDIAQGGSNNRCNSMFVDQSGNIYSVGYFGAPADFNPSAFSFSLTPVAANDGFVSKLNSMGDFVWAVPIAGSLFDDATGVTVDNSGNVTVAGTFSGTADFDPSITGVVNLTAFGLDDMFICNYDAMGNFVSVYQFGGTGYDIPYSLNATANGNTFVTGYFTGTADFDPSINVSNLSSNGNDIFILGQGPGSVGINNPEDEMQMSIFPNPAIDILSIHSAQATEVTIYNQTGAVVEHFNHPGGDLKLNVNHYPKGVYYSSFKNPGIIKTIKFGIQ